MIIDIIVILKCYLIFLFTRSRGCPYSVPISEYGQCPSDTLCHNTDTMYTTSIYYILLMNQSDKLQLHYL